MPRTTRSRARRGSARRSDQENDGGDQADVVHVIKGVIEAERGAIDYYNAIIEYASEHGDPVTADMVTTILADEEGHLRLFEGFLR